MALLGSVLGVCCCILSRAKGAKRISTGRQGNAESDSSLGGAQRFWGIVGGSDAASADAIQDSCVRSGSVRSSAFEFCVRGWNCALIRYFGVGYLAVKYGNNALPFLAQHKVDVTIVLAVFAE